MRKKQPTHQYRIEEIKDEYESNYIFGNLPRQQKRRTKEIVDHFKEIIRLIDEIDELRSEELRDAGYDPNE